MKTDNYRIRDICKIKSGKRLPAGFTFSADPTPYRYIRSRDIKEGMISLDDVAYIDEETKKRINKYIINAGDIAITIVEKDLAELSLRDYLFGNGYSSEIVSSAIPIRF